MHHGACRVQRAYPGPLAGIAFLDFHVGPYPAAAGIQEGIQTRNALAGELRREPGACIEAVEFAEEKSDSRPTRSSSDRASRHAERREHRPSMA